jgi:tRNA pseudouridine55 synthase
MKPLARPDQVGDGIVLVDKPTDWTSHDVVARLRRLAGTRRVGHAGTLDPAATGLLIAGIGRGTRLLTYLTGCDKAYQATIRLGQATLTDDSAGEVIFSAPPGLVESLTDAAVAAAIRSLTGPIEQVPSAVSAIKVNGQRAYARVRAGQTVALAARPVTVARFDVLASCRRHIGSLAGDIEPTAAWPEPVFEPPAGGLPTVWDLAVEVEVSSGTYVRALARDLGTALGVGGHLTALRRTRVGPFAVDQALTLEALAESWQALTLAAAAARLFPLRRLTETETVALSRGQTIAPSDSAGAQSASKSDLTAAIDDDGQLVALIANQRTAARPVAVFQAAT